MTSTQTYLEHELLFLTHQAREYQWNAQTTRIFIGRMLHGNRNMTQESLCENLRVTNHVVCDTLANTIVPKLRTEGYRGKNWQDVQKYLRETLFPQWLKLQWWSSMWEQAQPTQQIHIELEPPTGRISIAGSRISTENLVEIPIVPIGSRVNFNVTVAADRHLILLDKDGNGSICCLAPSRVFPRFAIVEPVAREQLLAVVSSREPQLSWLTAAQHGFLELDAAMLQELKVWMEGDDSCQLWQREFEIVA